MLIFATDLTWSNLVGSSQKLQMFYCKLFSFGYCINISFLKCNYDLYSFHLCNGKKLRTETM